MSIDDLPSARWDTALGAIVTQVIMASVLVAAAATLGATGRPVVLVLTGGSPIELNWAKENVPAILMVWYPGEAGGEAAQQRFAEGGILNQGKQGAELLHKARFSGGIRRVVAAISTAGPAMPAPPAESMPMANIRPSVLVM